MQFGLICGRSVRYEFRHVGMERAVARSAEIGARNMLVRLERVAAVSTLPAVGVGGAIS